MEMKGYSMVMKYLDTREGDGRVEQREGDERVGKREGGRSKKIGGMVK